MRQEEIVSRSRVESEKEEGQHQQLPPAAAAAVVVCEYFRLLLLLFVSSLTTTTTLLSVSQSILWQTMMNYYIRAHSVAFPPKY